MKVHVAWLDNPSHVDGGAWALFSANGHLVAEMAQKGRNARAKQIADRMARGFNIQENVVSAPVTSKMIGDTQFIMALRG